MESTTLDTMAQRLNRLEGENRRWRRLGVIAVVVLAGVALMGQARPKVAKSVEAEEFVLRDAMGAVRARFSMTAAGGPALVLFHKSVTQPENPPHALDLQVIDDDPAVGLLGPGLTRVGLRDAHGQMLAKLEVTTRGQASLTLRDEGFRVRAVVGHAELENASTGSVEQRPASSVVLFDKEGKLIWKMP